MRKDRRRFIVDCATAFGAAALTRFASGELAPDDAPASAIPIIDPHLHIWDLKQFRLSWLDNAEPVLKRDFSLEDYRSAIHGLHIEKSLYVEVSVTPEQRPAEARHVIDICRQPNSPLAGAVIGGVPGSDGFDAYIRQFAADAHVRGVRCSYPRPENRSLRFVDDLKTMGKLGLCFDLLLDAAMLEDAAQVAGSCPDTPFILDHCGNASTAWFGADASDDIKRRAESWRAGIAMLAAQKNVACKISGVAESGHVALATLDRIAPIVNHCLESFGDDRVMFASNWPVCLKSITIADWLRMVQQITAGRTEAFMRKLFSENARNWYMLDGARK